MAEKQTALALTYAPVVVAASSVATAPAAAGGTDELYPSDVRPAVGRTSTEATSTAAAEPDSVRGGDQLYPSPVSTATSTVEPAGLPPRRLDCCDRCGSSGEEEPRRRVFYRRAATGLLLCVDCEKVVPR